MTALHKLGLVALLTFALGACAEAEFASQTAKELQGPSGSHKVGEYKVGKPYQVAGVWYYPKVDYDYDSTGIASWYGPGFHGRLTANGEIYDQNDLTAAHPTLPMPSIVRVTNLENGRAIVVRVNDRGPFKHGRIIDMSRRGAQLLGFEGQGTAKVRVEVLEDESRQHAALAQGGQLVASAPPAVPTESVTAVPLEAPGSSQAAAQPQAVAQDAPAAERQIAAEWPDGKVAQTPVQPSRIYVQAGAFARADYANRLRARLSGLARTEITPAQVGAQQFFRVRLGPLASVAEADRVLQTLIANGINEARVVVD